MAKTTHKSGEEAAQDKEIEAGAEAAEIVEVSAAPTAKESPDKAPEPKPVHKTRRRGLPVFLGLVLGGVVAASIGFYAARYLVPEGWPFPGVTPDPDPILVEQVAQSERLNALEGRAGDMSATITELQTDQTAEALTIQLESAEMRLAELANTLNALNTRLSVVEKIPRGSGTEAAEAAAAAYERELAKMRKMLASELARIEAAGVEARTAGQDAAQEAQQAAARAALAQLQMALESGQPFEGALDAISEATGQAIPEVLKKAAGSGAPTLPQLQNDFPAAARMALDAALAAAVADGSVGRFAGFMRSQLGARSLEPREGDDPDAILSRAEEALRQGQIATALQEIGALPEVGRTKMAGWSQQAQMRLDVLQATETLTAQISGE